MNMDEVWLFVTNILLGYVLQGIGYLVGVYAICRVKIEWKRFLLLAVLFSLLGWGIRSISAISFGFHTMLFMIACILLAVCLLKTPLFQTVISVLCTSGLILLLEMAVVMTAKAIFGAEWYASIFQSTVPLTVEQQIQKNLVGLPVNVVLILCMSGLYLVHRRFWKRKHGGQTAESVK